MTKWFVLNGHEVEPVGSLEEWARRFEAQDRHVAQDDMGDIRVSTVFLGFNHGWGDGPPLLFETMIFGGPNDGYQERYSTWNEAERGHARAVSLVQSQ
jgi:hypothetical protein